MTKRSAGILTTFALIGLATAGCGSDAMNNAVEGAGQLKDKAVACAEAIGLADFDPGAFAPDQLETEAAEKAQQARDLGNQVVEQDLKKTLFDLADDYVELEQREAKGLGTINDWVQRNSAQFDTLRQVCL